MVSNLSFGSGVVVIVSSQAHLAHVSTLSGPGTSPVSGQLSEPTAWRRRPCCLGFLLPFGHRHSLLGPSCSRRGVRPSSRSAYRATSARTPTGFPRSTCTRHDRGGCPLYPGAAVFTRPAMPPGRRLPLLNGQPCTPAQHPIRPGLTIDEASSGVHSRSPVRSSPRLWPPDGTGVLGLSPELRTPPLPATHVKAGTGHRTLTRDYVIDITADLQSQRATCTCDLVSHHPQDALLTGGLEPSQVPDFQHIRASSRFGALTQPIPSAHRWIEAKRPAAPSPVAVWPQRSSRLRALSRDQPVTATTSSSSLPLSFFDALAYALANFVVISARDPIDSPLLTPTRGSPFRGHS